MKNQNKFKNGLTDKVIQNILAYGGEGSVSVKNRLMELRKEWDIDRAVEMNGAVLTIAGIALGFMVNKGWLSLPVVVGAMMLEQALQGWNPLVPLLRKLGFRSRKEIDAEKYGLKAVAGEFGAPVSAYQAVQAVRN